jgi:hypothetical protein
MGVTAGIFLASMLLKEMRYLVYIRYLWNQLVFIVHKIYEALEQGKEVCMIFLDISKAFDKVWHKGLLGKLESVGVRDPLLKWIRSYLSDSMQHVIIDGQSSDWDWVEAGVPQGSVLGPLLF